LPGSDPESFFDSLYSNEGAKYFDPRIQSRFDMVSTIDQKSHPMFSFFTHGHINVTPQKIAFIAEY